MQSEVDELRKEILGIKTEIKVLVQYLSTVSPADGQPLLGPGRWTAYQGDLKRALEAEGL